MRSHPINLALRFGLELVTLLAIGDWGWACLPLPTSRPPRLSSAWWSCCIMSLRIIGFAGC